MRLENFNVDTLGTCLHEVLDRLETVETLLLTFPGLNEYAAEALAGTNAAETVLGGVEGLMDAIAPAKPAPVPVPAPVRVAAPAPADKMMVAGKPTPAQLLKALAEQHQGT